MDVNFSDKELQYLSLPEYFEKPESSIHDWLRWMRRSNRRGKRLTIPEQFRRKKRRLENEDGAMKLSEDAKQELTEKIRKAARSAAKSL